MLELIESGNHSGAVYDVIGVDVSHGGTGIKVDVSGELVVSVGKCDGILTSSVTIGIFNINTISTSTNIKSQWHSKSTRNVCLVGHKTGYGTLEF